MIQITFRCKKDGVEFIFKNGVGKVESYEIQQQYPNAIYQHLDRTVAQQSGEFKNSINEHFKH